jgi:hypothetical protein
MKCCDTFFLKEVRLMRYFHASAVLLALMTLAGGCNETSGANEAEPILNYHICIGDLRLVIPRDEAGMFRVGRRPLLSEPGAYLSVENLSPLPGENFVVAGPDGNEIQGSFFLTFEEMLDHDSVRETAPVERPGREILGELLGKPMLFVVSPQPIPGPANKGHLMTASRRLGDTAIVMMHLKTNDISKAQVQDYLSGLEDTLVRWSSGQVLREPDGDPQCPASSS